MDFQTLKANRKRDFSGMRGVKIALLGDSATQFLHTALRGYGWEARLAFEVYEAPYDQIEREALDSAAGLREFDPDFTLIFPSAAKLQQAFRKLPADRRREFAADRLAWIDGIWQGLQREKPRRILQCNFPEPEDGAFGHYANKVEHSFLFQVRKINLGLMEMARRNGGVFLLDLAMLQSRHGRTAAFSPQQWVNADLSLSLDFLPHVAKAAADIVSAALGGARKCLILDLDNTLWGGVVGDDGWEGIQIGDLGVGKVFTEFQWWAKQLKERGVVLAVCSQNDERIAREAFEKHPDMVLSLEDFAVFTANWEPKYENIRAIQAALDIGFDSMVFLDDNPFERERVRAALPEVLVPDLPEDPAEYVPFLVALDPFEPASFSEEDSERTRMYREESGRRQLSSHFTSEADFLAGLEMTAAAAPFNRFNIPRVAQLSQRSNQFNLRTVRYTEREIEAAAVSPDCLSFAVTLRDRFGDYGLISAALLRRKSDHWFIDTWIMSCRVLKRGVEELLLARLAAAARSDGARKLVGEYLPTPKNALVKDHYARLGFRAAGNLWELDLETFRPPAHFIKEA